MKFRCLFRSLLLFLLTYILTVEIADAQYGYTRFNYTYKNGLPQSSIKSMALDSLGYLWLSSEAGLLRFDGINFKEFNKLTDKQIIGNYFHDFFQTASGKIIATDIYGGLYSIENGKPVLIKKGNLDAINFLDAKGVFPDPSFYVKYTTPHLKLAIDTSWQYPVLNIFAQTAGNYVVRTKNGLGIYEAGSLKKIIDLSDYSPLGFFSLGPEVYFYTSSDSIYHLAINNYSIEKCRITGNGLYGDLFSATNNRIFFFDFPKQTAYIVNGNKLLRLSKNYESDDINVQIVTDQLPEDCIVRAVCCSDKHQILAIATDTKGLFIYKNRKFNSIVNTMPAPGTTNGYYSQLILDSTRLLTDWGLEFDQYGAYPTKLPIARNIAENIFRDRHNNIWYSHGDTLLKYNTATNIIETIAYLKSNRAVCFFQSGDSLIIGTLKNVYSYKNNVLNLIGNISSSRANANPFTVFTYQDNKIWFGTIKGLFIFNPQTHVIDTIRELYQSMVHNIKLFKDFILIGTYGNGFYLHKNGRTVKMPLDKNQYLQFVHTFVYDRNGMMWMSTNRGLFKCRFSDLENYFNNTNQNVHYTFYDETDGILNTEFNGGCTSASVTLPNGFVSLPTMEGLVWFKPDDFKDVNDNTPIIVDEVYLDDKPVNTNNLNIESSVENMRVMFSSPHWGHTDNLAMEYKLEGLNKNWKHLNGSQHAIEFSKLKSGVYTLYIRKKTGLQPGSFITTSLNFYVEKKYYETLWFGVLIVSALTLLIIAITRLYARNIKMRNKLLEENVRLRTEELSIANVRLQQSVSDKDKLISIISHDVVTPLRFIAMVARKSEEAFNQHRNDAVKSSLTEIKKTSEKLYINSQNILNWIKHQNKRITVKEEFVAVAAIADEVIDSLAELSEAKHNVILNNISPDDILKTDENILSIILHNLLTNAIKFTENGTITFHSANVDNRYCIYVNDTGSGIASTQLSRIQKIIAHENVNAINSSSGAESSGLGYIIITELIALLEGKIAVESYENKGTSVTLLFDGKRILSN